MIKCSLSETTNPQLQYLIECEGNLSITLKNKKRIASFVTKNEQEHFEFQISTYLNDLSVPGCSEAWYEDIEGFKYTFFKPDNVNPLWEMEKGINFTRNSTEKSEVQH